MAELIRKIVKSTNELNRVAYLTTIDGVSVTPSPVSRATPMPTPIVLPQDGGGGSGRLSPNWPGRAARSSSPLGKGGIELGESPRPRAHSAGAATISGDGINDGRRGGSSSLLRPTDTLYMPTATRTMAAEARQDRDPDTNSSRYDDPVAGRVRDGSEASSTAPLRPRSRSEQVSDEDV